MRGGYCISQDLIGLGLKMELYYSINLKVQLPLKQSIMTIQDLEHIS